MILWKIKGTMIHGRKCFIIELLLLRKSAMDSVKK